MYAAVVDALVERPQLALRRAGDVFPHHLAKRALRFHVAAVVLDEGLPVFRRFARQDEVSLSVWLAELLDELLADGHLSLVLRKSKDFSEGIQPCRKPERHAEHHCAKPLMRIQPSRQHSFRAEIIR